MGYEGKMRRRCESAKSGLASRNLRREDAKKLVKVTMEVTTIFLRRKQKGKIMIAKRTMKAAGTSAPKRKRKKAKRTAKKAGVKKTKRRKTTRKAKSTRTTKTKRRKSTAKRKTVSTRKKTKTAKRKPAARKARKTVRKSAVKHLKKAG